MWGGPRPGPTGPLHKNGTGSDHVSSKSGQRVADIAAGGGSNILQIMSRNKVKLVRMKAVKAHQRSKKKLMYLSEQN